MLTRDVEVVPPPSYAPLNTCSRRECQRLGHIAAGPMTGHFYYTDIQTVSFVLEYQCRGGCSFASMLASRNDGIISFAIWYRHFPYLPRCVCNLAILVL